MHDKLIKAFQKAKYKATSKLEENVWHTISLRHKRNDKFKLYILASVGIASLVGLIPSFKILSNDLVQSGFYEYFSLLFSNNGIPSYWKELTFSIAESLPTLSIILTLSLIFISLMSIRQFVKQIINNQLFTQGSLVV